MKTKATIIDIAKAANVSITTASRVLNNKSEGFSEETRNRVLQVIEKYDYTPSMAARSLVTKKTNLISVFVPDIRNPFYPEISRGIESAAYKKGINAMLFNSDLEDEKVKRQISMCVERNVDGIILVCQYLPLEDVISITEKSDIPIVAIGSKHKNQKYNVYTDGEHGAYIATEHLIRRGHKGIACIESFPSRIVETEDMNSRTIGYTKALSAYGLPVVDHLIVKGDSTEQSGRKSMKELLNYSGEFTAVFIQNDAMAFSAYQVIKEANLRIPDDISIIGYDDISYCAISDPPLTTVRQPTYEMGFTAMSMLARLIENQTVRSRIKVFQPELIVRGSTRVL